MLLKRFQVSWRVLALNPIRQVCKFQIVLNVFYSEWHSIQVQARGAASPVIADDSDFWNYRYLVPEWIGLAGNQSTWRYTLEENKKVADFFSFTTVEKPIKAEKLFRWRLMCSSSFNMAQSVFSGLFMAAILMTSSTAARRDLRLTVLHLNDFHAHVEQVSENLTRCRTGERLKHLTGDDFLHWLISWMPLKHIPIEIIPF